MQCSSLPPYCNAAISTKLNVRGKAPLCLFEAFHLNKPKKKNPTWEPANPWIIHLVGVDFQMYRTVSCSLLLCSSSGALGRGWNAVIHLPCWIQLIWKWAQNEGVRLFGVAGHLPDCHPAAVISVQSMESYRCRERGGIWFHWHLKANLSKLQFLKQ